VHALVALCAIVVTLSAQRRHKGNPQRIKECLQLISGVHKLNSFALCLLLYEETLGEVKNTLENHQRLSGCSDLAGFCTEWVFHTLRSQLHRLFIGCG